MRLTPPRPPRRSGGGCASSAMSRARRSSSRSATAREDPSDSRSSRASSSGSDADDERPRAHPPAASFAISSIASGCSAVIDLAVAGNDPGSLGLGRIRARDVLPGWTDTGVPIRYPCWPRLVAYSRQSSLRQLPVGCARFQVRSYCLRVAEAPAAEVAGCSLHGLPLLPVGGAPWS